MSVKKPWRSAGKLAATLHSLALRLLRQAGLLETYPTRPLVLEDWKFENICDAEFGEAEGIKSRPRREKIRRFYEALWSTGVPNAPTYVPPDPPISDGERQFFGVFHQPTARVYSAILPGEIVRNCVQATVSRLMDRRSSLELAISSLTSTKTSKPADLEFVVQLVAAGVVIFVAGDDDQSIYSFRYASPSESSDSGRDTRRTRCNTVSDAHPPCSPPRRVSS